ncbi:membrane-spanning 4-domains subfamily A member 18-like isoform X1 [Centroberyx affinis]|uniref:membrane-spanning 4-domains subfamily A member 18-like isoform X1 n=1 Tax=Centroberyx affinis TaxID=166261 RepID=UPI003A5C08B5
MSLTVTTEEGLVKVTVTSDPGSCWPPLCQIFWNMLYNPVKSDVSEDQSRSLRVRYHRALGVVQMLIGLVGMFLVVSLRHSSNGAASNMTWLGFVFITSGMVSILAEEHPFIRLVILSMVINLVAAALALTGIGLYVADLRGILEVVLIILAVLQLVVNTSTSVFAMEAMSHNRNMENEEDEPLVKEVLIGSAEKGLCKIPLLTSP